MSDQYVKELETSFDIISSQLKEKTAEIERLKAEIIHHIKGNVELTEAYNTILDCQMENQELKLLIQELADWVRDHSYLGHSPSQDLERRAREATKD